MVRASHPPLSQQLALLLPLLAGLCPVVVLADTDATGDVASSATMVVVSDRLSEVAPGSYRARASSLASKQPVSFLEQARTIDTVTDRVMADHDLDTLNESLALVAGVTEGNNMGGTEDGFIKRGFGSNSDGSILIDGIRQPRGTFSMATVDHVEVLKGPASLFHGTQAPGGVINLVTKKPQYHWHREVSGGASSFGGGNASVDVTGPIADSGLAFRLILSHQDEDSWRAFGNDRRTIIAPSLRWEGEHSRAMISYEYRDYDLNLDRGTVIVDGEPASVSRKRRFDEPWSHVYGHDEAVTAWWEQDVSDDWSVRLTHGWNRRQYSDGQPRVLSVDEDSGTLTRRADANHGFDRRVQYTSLDATGHFELAGQRHDLVIGADNERRRDYLAKKYRGTSVSDASIYDIDYGQLALDSNSLSTSRSNRLDESESTGVYVNDRWHLNERWILGLGGRFTRISQYAGAGQDFVVTTDTDDSLFLPSLSLLYRLDDATSAYASYSESFVPNGADADTGQTLDPEHGSGYELGLKREWNERLSTSMALYRIRKENVAVSDNGTTRTIGEAGSQGVELSLTGALTDRLSLLASYAYTDTEVLKDTGGTEGNRLPNAARHAASLYLAHDLNLTPGQGDWRVGGGIRYVGEREGDDENSFTLDDYTVADAFIAWDTHWLGDDTHLQLNVKNLFDTTYYPSSGGSTRVVVGDPREISLQASVDW
ncbi:iron complex outermembrane recepter protein [Chromohalobacter canadensis]|uniref:Iron complex outermembrane recepter protein n=1 Tax=Chromohalobacter canadensis TaxID=141389 RepID=A0A285VND6_9GAMM|nr:TonB-dependent siderophore receptor [Chromohalobacter canadensis]SOC54101.1 iron complex outermembrane recepter protein [Chromohalobacter canadensis]